MKPYAIYFAVLALCCLICPPLLGIVMGVAIFCALWWVGFKLIGG
jgi:hypothetical protein